MLAALANPGWRASPTPKISTAAPKAKMIRSRSGVIAAGSAKRLDEPAASTRPPAGAAPPAPETAAGRIE